MHCDELLQWVTMVIRHSWSSYHKGIRSHMTMSGRWSSRWNKISRSSPNKMPTNLHATNTCNNIRFSIWFYFINYLISQL